MSPDLLVKFTEFESAESAEGNDVTVPWVDFATLVIESGFFVAESKKQLPLIVPVEFAEGTVRKTLDNVERVWFGALDFDELTCGEMEDVIERIQAQGFEAIVYTTWGHPKVAPKLNKFRVLIPFSRPVRKREWPLFWQMFNNLLGGKGDPKCKDPSHGYFAPGVEEGTSEEHKLLVRFEGQPLDVSHVMSGVDTLNETDLADIGDAEKESIDRDRVLKFAKKKAASSNEYTSWMGTLLLKMLKGEVFAESGDRDNTAFKMAQDLGKAFPHGDPESLAILFAPSLSHMGSDAPTVEVVRDKIRRAQHSETVRKLREEKTKVALDQNVRDRLGVPDDYDKEYISAFCKETGNGATFDMFSQRLIVQRGARYYVFSANTYWPFSKDELSNACRDLFKPAEGSLGVSIYNVSDKGLETPKSPTQLVHDFGVVAKREEIRIWANATYYDESTQTLVDAPYPRRPLEPTYHEEVDEWLQDISGTDTTAEALKDWLAVAPDLQRPLAMLVFIGKTGVGKSSFAKALARIWTTAGYTKMYQAFESFNTELRKSPVLLADEELPRDFKGRVMTERIRSLISSDEHQLNAKNRDIVTMRGYFRTVAALNSIDKFDLGGSHSREDVEAIQARTLIVHAQPKANFDYELFVNQDALAEHALHLHATREVKESRFGVTAHNHFVELIRDKIADGVFSWAIWFVEDRKLEEERSLPAFVMRENVYVSSEGLCKFWMACFTEQKNGPNRRDLAQALRLVSAREDEPVRVLTPGGHRVRYYCIKGEMLVAYAEREGLDVELLRVRLQICTEQLGSSGFFKAPKWLRPTEQELEANRFAKKRLRQMGEDALDVVHKA